MKSSNGSSLPWNKVQTLLYVWGFIWLGSLYFLSLIYRIPVACPLHFGHVWHLQSHRYAIQFHTALALYLLSILSGKPVSPLLFIWFIIETHNIKMQVKNLLLSKVYRCICSVQWSLWLGFIFYFVEIIFFSHHASLFLKNIQFKETVLSHT